MNNHQPHTEDQPHPGLRRYFQLDSEFRSAFVSLLAGSPAGEIVLLDATGEIFGFNSAAVTAAMNAWIVQPGARLKICTFDERYLQDQSHAFQTLRGRHSNLVDWRVAPAALAPRVQMSAACSRTGLVKKPVRSAFHGIESEDAQDIAGQLDYFAQIWETCELAPPATTLGL